MSREEILALTDEQIRAIAEAMERGVQAMRQAVEGFARAFERAAATYAARERALAHAIMAALWRQYADDGAPYGATQQGLVKWLLARSLDNGRTGNA